MTVQDALRSRRSWHSQPCCLLLLRRRRHRGCSARSSRARGGIGRARINRKMKPPSIAEAEKKRGDKKDTRYDSVRVYYTHAECPICLQCTGVRLSALCFQTEEDFVWGVSGTSELLAPSCPMETEPPQLCNPRPPFRQWSWECTHCRWECTR